MSIPRFVISKQLLILLLFWYIFLVLLEGTKYRLFVTLYDTNFQDDIIAKSLERIDADDLKHVELTCRRIGSIGSR